MRDQWIERKGADMGIVFFHGLGATGQDLMPLAEPVDQALSDHTITWCFPQAPNQPVTLNGGMVMPAWFDILSLDKGVEEDTKGILQATHHAMGLLAQMHAKGIPWNRIVLCGFSQGGALALSTMVKHKPDLAGVVSFSGYLPSCMREETDPLSFPICLLHGKRDEVVSFQYAKVAHRWLVDQGFDARLHAFDMEHAIDRPCLVEFIQYLSTLFAL